MEKIRGWAKYPGMGTGSGSLDPLVFVQRAGGLLRRVSPADPCFSPFLFFPEFPVSKPDLLSRLAHEDEPTALDLHVPKDAPSGGEPPHCAVVVAQKSLGLAPAGGFLPPVDISPKLKKMLGWPECSARGMSWPKWKRQSPSAVS